MVAVPGPQAVSSMTPFMFDSDFTFGTVTFNFFPAPSSFLAKFLFQKFVFIKRHVRLSLGDKEPTQWHASLPAHELSSGHAVSSH